MVFRIILGGVSVGLIGFALSKLILFVKNQGSHFNVPQVCLGLEIISNMCKLNCKFVVFQDSDAIVKIQS